MIKGNTSSRIINEQGTKKNKITILEIILVINKAHSVCKNLIFIILLSKISLFL